MEPSSSAQGYSIVADLLSKFHTAPEFIQALWLVSVPVTVLGVTWLVMRALRDLIGLTRRERGRLVYGVYQDEQGRWLVYRHGHGAQEIDWSNPPSELTGRSPIIQGLFGRPDA